MSKSWFFKKYIDKLVANINRKKREHTYEIKNDKEEIIFKTGNIKSTNTILHNSMQLNLKT